MWYNYYNSNGYCDAFWTVCDDTILIIILKFEGIMLFD